MPIQHFSAEKPFAINESAFGNPTGLEPHYDASSSVGRLIGTQAKQFRRCGLSVMRKKIVRSGAAASVRTKETEGPGANGSLRARQPGTEIRRQRRAKYPASRGSVRGQPGSAKS